ncbi:MAG: hypothetical protein FJY10_10910 [Bacteroidetes bacterium]|nr:hypothetical protein [Bacteroidota bacterium]
MKHISFTPRLIFVISIIAIAALVRLLPHWPNFTPIAAMALFGGTYLTKRYQAFLIPMLAMFLSDLFLGMHYTMFAVYASFAIIVAFGFILRKTLSTGTIFLASIFSSVTFFLITNFAAWVASPFYPQTFQGLIECYIAGLAFFHDGTSGISFFMNDLLGTLFFNSLFFGAFYLSQMQFPSLEKAE